MGNVLVIGAGLIGSSIAWRLAQAGRAVTLVDAGRIGCEASWAGAGMLSPGGEFTEKNIWLDLALESRKLYPDFVAELQTEAGLAIDSKICGLLDVTRTAKDRAIVDQRAKAKAALGIASESTAEGVLYPGDGYVDPRHLSQALSRACARRDVLVRENAAIDRVEAGDWGEVVLAAGAWSSSVQIFSGGRPVPLIGSLPIKGHLIGYRLQPGSLGPMRRRGETYIVQRASGFTLTGSNEERIGFDRSVDPSICDQLHRSAAELWPELEGKQPTERWIGFRPGTVDGLPHIGRVADTNVWLAYGHYRSGILLAPVTAQRIASDLTGLTSSSGKD